MPRPLALAALAAALVAVVIAAVPSLVRLQAESALSDRFGGATVEDADIGWGRVVLTGVVIEDLGVLHEIALDAGPIDLAVLGTSGITRVDVAGCDLDVASLRGSGSGSGTPAEGGPTIAVTDCRLTLRDDGGVLITTTASIDATPATVSAVLDGTTVGGDLAAAERVTITASRVGGLRLARLEAVSPRARWGDQLEDVERRIRAVLLPAASPIPEPDAPESTVLERLLARTTTDFALEIEGGTLESVREDDTVETFVAGLHLNLDRLDDRVSTSGTGEPTHGGVVEWDLVLDPVAPSASGTVHLDDVPLAVFLPVLPDLPFHHPELALVSADVTLTSADAASIDGSGSIRVRELALSHPRIAPEPVQHVAFDLEGRGTWAPPARRLTLQSLDVRAGNARVTLEGALEWDVDHYLVDMHAVLPRTPCDAVVHAIPADLLGDLTALELTGALSGQLDVHVDSRTLEATTLSIEMADACTFVTVPASLDVNRLAGPFLHRVVEPDSDEFQMETGPGTSNWAPLTSISPFLVHAVLAHEDSSFFRHHGFAPWAIREALIRNLTEGRYVMGASTITMQLVKNVFLHREKTLARKIQEVLITWWVESVLSKEQILELYLNVIELGPRVYGIRDGAEHWFGRSPAELSVAESAYLACILPNPSVFAADHRPEGAPPASFRRRMRNLVRHLGESGRIDAEALAAGLADIDTLAFHVEGTTPTPWVSVGHAAALPIEGWSASSELPDESGWDGGTDDGEIVEDDAAAFDEAAGLDDTPRGWEEL